MSCLSSSFSGPPHFAAVPAKTDPLQDVVNDHKDLRRGRFAAFSGADRPSPFFAGPLPQGKLKSLCRFQRTLFGPPRSQSTVAVAATLSPGSYPLIDHQVDAVGLYLALLDMILCIVEADEKLRADFKP